MAVTPASLSRRAFVAVSAGAVLAGCRVGFAQAASRDDGAWALWDEVVRIICAEYLEPVDPADLTAKAASLLAAAYTPDGPALLPPDFTTDAAKARTLYQAFIDSLAAKLGRRATVGSLVELSLSRYCESHLKFSEYVPHADAEALRVALTQADPGVKIKLKPGGQFLCDPFQQGEAWRSGVRTGDELMAVAGVPVAGMSGRRIRSRLNGPAGSTVTMTVRKSDGRTIDCKVLRRPASGSVLTSRPLPGGGSIAIPVFNPQTPGLLRSALAGVKAGQFLALDLRDCEGGVVDAAVTAAALFVGGARPLKVGTMESRGTGGRELTSPEAVICPACRITILVNDHTASAAELFALFLRESLPRVRVAGSKTFGKSLWQEALTPSNAGGQLTISRGLLRTAAGTEWTKGIEPDVPV